MKESTRNLLFQAWEYCDDEDKSTEFMLQYMADFAKVDQDTVVNFITNPKNQQEYIKRTSPIGKF